MRGKKEFDELLKNEEFNKPDRIRLVEVFMRRGDARGVEEAGGGYGSANKYE